MNHEFLSRQDAPEGASDRSFGLVFAAFFTILAVLDYFSKLPFALSPIPVDGCPWLSAHPEWAAHGWSVVFLAVGLVFLLLALLIPKALAPLNWVWTKFGLLLHRLVSPVVLGVMFFLIFAPLGMVMRMFGGDPLRLRFDPKAESYWITRSPPGPVADSLKDQF